MINAHFISNTLNQHQVLCLSSVLFDIPFVSILLLNTLQSITHSQKKYLSKYIFISDWSLCVCTMLVAPVGVSSLADTPPPAAPPPAPAPPPPQHQTVGMKKSASDSHVVSGDHTPNTRRSSNPILGSSKQKVSLSLPQHARQEF